MTSRHPDALVFALCHEVGNLLTAMRLRADSLRPQAAELEATGGVLSSLAIRSAALLAQIRPLLAGPKAGAALPPVEALARLETDLSEICGDAVCVETSQAEGLPAISCDDELLHQLLIAAALAALEEGPGPVSVSASANRDRVVFAIASADSAGSPPEATRPSGLALVRAVGDEILGRLGGRASLGPGGLELELPAGE